MEELLMLDAEKQDFVNVLKYCLNSLNEKDERTSTTSSAHGGGIM